MTDNRAEWLEGICESVGEPAYHESDSAEILEISTTLLDWLEPKIRAAERARIVAWLRATYREQESWLWYELGESALEKVASYIERNAVS